MILEEVSALNEKGETVPGLAVLLVGEDPASQIYVRNKQKACEEVGFHSVVDRLPETASEGEVLDRIDQYAKDPSIHGILVQLPLPKHLDKNKILNTIPPEKDVDGFTELNSGRHLIGEDCLKPCTPVGVIHMLRHENIGIEGKECVVVGRSNIVGKPMALLLLSENGTVTVAHSKTKDLSSITKRADILVVAIKQPRFITGDMIKEGAVVIDVGMNREENGKLCGDVDYESAEKIASYLTPVPGGVGPMTIAMLLSNTLEARNRICTE